MSITHDDSAAPVLERPLRRRPASTRAGRRAVQPRVEAVECPRCGRFAARIIGRSETVPVVYLRCDGCHLTSVAAA